MWYYVDLMRALIAALALTLVIAVTAGVFAIWPAVADAPWEQDAPIVDSRGMRCEAALQLLNELMVRGSFDTSVGEGSRWEIGINIARGQIDDYC